MSPLYLSLEDAAPFYISVEDTIIFCLMKMPPFYSSVEAAAIFFFLFFRMPPKRTERIRRRNGGRKLPAVKLAVALRKAAIIKKAMIKNLKILFSSCTIDYIDFFALKIQLKLIFRRAK